MKRYRVAFICFITLLFFLHPIFTIKVRAEEIDRISDIGNKIEQYVYDHADTTAGMSVAVFDENDTIYQNCFGYMDVQNEVPVTEDTVMEWGSVSKLLVWISVMQLAEQDILDLEADINIYLPEGFLHNRTYDAPITMLNLMNHNAGFEESVIGMATGKENRIISIEEYLSEFQPEQVFEPGTVCAYSNWSTTLAAYIVERNSGMPYSEYVRTNIFEPLGMHNTSICADLSDNPDVKEKRMNLKIYTADVHEITPNMSYIIMYPAGMCISTIGDMQKFAQSLLSEDTILFHDAETYHELFSPSLYFEGTEIPRNYHGFWSLESYEAKIIGHNGNTAGCSSSLLLNLEEQVGIVIQTNQYSEQIYNMQMPELLFGKYAGTASDYTGLIMSARTIFHGPLKLYRLFSVSNVGQDEPALSYDVRTQENGIDKISCPYGDYLIIEPKDIALDITVLGSYGLILLYCALNIFRCLIGGIIDKVKGNRSHKILRSWYVAGTLLPFIPVVVFALMIPTLFNFQQWAVSTYRIALFLIFLSMLAMSALIVYGLIRLKNNTMTKLQKISIHSINICMTVTIVNILYWNWCMFRMI